MKTRESGMPDEGMWEGFFSPQQVLRSLGLEPWMRLAMEFGCGYGTFCLPAAAMISGRVVGLDIEPELVELCRRKGKDCGLHNAEFELRDFIAEGTGIAAGAADYVMLFNILHAECPEILLHEARRILDPDTGVLAVMHWRHDPRTPRGPPMKIRPRPEDCLKWAGAAGFNRISGIIDLPPWHYGFTAKH